MSDAYQGEIRMFAGTFAPFKWAWCDGQIQAVSENQALFSIIGTTYGGDGRSSFGLPEMRGRIPVGQGTGPGQTPRTIGQLFGVETVTLTSDNLPSHTHTLMASSSAQTTTEPVGNSFATINNDNSFYAAGVVMSELTESSDSAVESDGGNQPHDNIQPSLCINFIIATQGLYPPRS